eukprot:CAMPEP_0175075720 /NCGR_PEP_ID=MMETSP0052_2-20121109/22217_1 /TAXON_ID=51329 ORGANISM="Polytomella parva, Strain SAG 63-3" /NCGR_SAMPLE_ID=MMETSP0052_2 /ASSEMBLY_ACC=CAM_ASM_000194 /LENGTH=89 /DNA_ID=CAMNT_0016344557 /DNA_START=1 /DNA_END=268 /DNA_ORIENTATION=+
MQEAARMLMANLLEEHAEGGKEGGVEGKEKKQKVKSSLSVEDVGVLLEWLNRIQMLGLEGVEEVVGQVMDRLSFLYDAAVFVGGGEEEE